MGSKVRYNILVTGSAGFIGSHLVERLLLNYTVIGLDNLINGKLENIEEARKSLDFRFIKGDILDKKTCLESTKDIDIVYHLACLGVRHSIHSPFENHRVNAEGTINMLEASLINKVKKFFYISTSEVYGDIKIFPIKEIDVPVPKTIYGASKLAGENYAYAFYKCYGLDVTIFRIFNNYGPRAHYEGDAGEVIPRAIVNILYDKRPIVFGDGQTTRDFFYVKDTAEVLSGFIGLPYLQGEIINIGTGEEITIKKLVEKVLLLMGKDSSFINFIESRPADVPRLWVNNEKFKKILGFKSNLSFEEGLSETISYYKKLKQKKELISDIEDKNWIK